MNKYTDMQKNQYEDDASRWSIENRDPVVGGFDLHQTSRSRRWPSKLDIL